MGYFDEDGFLHIVDRIKELIKHNRYQVAPAELEAILLGHPQVLDAAVIPVEDEEAGQTPMAYLVLNSQKNKSFNLLLIRTRNVQIIAISHPEEENWKDITRLLVILNNVRSRREMDAVG
ncbi:hypothetical protein POTOM_036944 [Populus tomentosa]|uniref:AMP-binding enzyme C-terminal domain-containing protein n=2 Tax=Populus TaxID=3689 RepID=A0A8X7Z3A0_POPTO|nr:hypothetical protein POTOM_036944 [Populus tomentosa]